MILTSQVKALTTIRETVKTVDSIEIEIVLNIPDGKGTFPVLFYVHGGGWDHGTALKTPGGPPLVSASTMCDNLGVVFVGVDYRCKNQNGDFDKALQDVMDVYNYAHKNAKRFKCDFKKIGFAGGSAGTPLSAVAAQKISTCKLYIGIYGKYDFMNKNLGGYWPSQQTLEKYKIVTPEEQKRASAITQIRKNPPATLLIHGDADPTIGYKQSVEFAAALEQHNGYAKVLILPGIAHGFYKEGSSEAYISATKEIMEHLIQFFKIKNPNRQGVIDALDSVVNEVKKNSKEKQK
ncbi:MAG: alpha/beta hydrolase [Paludibacter sp.]|nr:alpha/beta hydrolase [Paludibacter sp.]